MINFIKNLFSNKDNVPEKPTETISSLEFKKQISKRLSENLRTLGFKGSGFHYKLLCENFIFTIGIQPSRNGGSCCAEFGIQPIELVEDAKKIKYYDCEFRTRIFDNENGDQWWEYSNIEDVNLKNADNIFQIFQKKYFALVEKLNSEIYPFDIIEPVNVSDFGNLQRNIFNGHLMCNTKIRFIWILTEIYKKRNISKARKFAEKGIELIKKDNINYFTDDFLQILEKDN